MRLSACEAGLWVSRQGAESAEVARRGINRRLGELFSTPWKGAAPTEAPTEGALSGECRMIG